MLRFALTLFKSIFDLASYVFYILLVAWDRYIVLSSWTELLLGIQF